MGKVGAPWYCEDLGSAIEEADKILTAIKTNKYDEEDLLKFKKSLENICVAIIKTVNENKN